MDHLPDPHASDSSSSNHQHHNSSKDDLTLMDPRERSREAVRKCRQRKRERVERLKQEATELAHENSMLRTRLEMGSEVESNQKVSRGTSLFHEMTSLLINKDQNEGPLKHVVELYHERHTETGRDKLAALKYVVNGLARHLKPSALSWVHLHLLSQPDDFYNVASSEPTQWAELVQALALTSDQVDQLLARRLSSKRARAEVSYTAQRVAGLQRRVAEREDACQRFNGLFLDALRPWQFAELLRWCVNDPCCKELLEILWDDLTRKIDSEIEVERQALATTDPNMQQVHEALEHVRYENAREIKRLFSLSMDNRHVFVRIIQKIFHPDCVLIDPSNGGEYLGHEGILRYVEKMKRAFTASNGVDMHVEERAIELQQDKILAKFIIKGSYQGMLAPDQPVAVQIDAVMSVGFTAGSHLIKDVVVSNNMLGLVSSLSQGLAASEKAAATLIDATSKRLEELMRLFQMQDEKEAVALARRILTPRCVFVDSNQGSENKGLDECCAYLARLRRAFPKLTVQASNTEELDSKLTLKSEWHVAAEYGGALAKQKRPCTLKGVLFVSFELEEDDSVKICLVKMGWDAASLLRELGVFV